MTTSRDFKIYQEVKKREKLSDVEWIILGIKYDLIRLSELIGLKFKYKNHQGNIMNIKPVIYSSGDYMVFAQYNEGGNKLLFNLRNLMNMEFEIELNKSLIKKINILKSLITKIKKCKNIIDTLKKRHYEFNNDKSYEVAKKIYKYSRKNDYPTIINFLNKAKNMKEHYVCLYDFTKNRDFSNSKNENKFNSIIKFENGKNTAYFSQKVSKLINFYFRKSDIKSLYFLPMPSRDEYKYKRKFMDLSQEVHMSTGIKNGYKFNEYGMSIYLSDKIKGKKIIVFGSVLDKINEFKKFVQEVKNKGGEVVMGVFLGKMDSENQFNIEKPLNLDDVNRRWNIRNIKEYVKMRGINNLIHFTSYSNLKSILNHGLLPVDELKSRNFIYKKNDPDRKDNRTDAISLSISFPNYKMFTEKRYKLTDRNWVVLVLEKSVLWEKNCIFVNDNAANPNQSNNIKNHNMDWNNNINELKNLFCAKKDYKGNEIKRATNIGYNMTTDPQAEVLVCENIERKYIKEVHYKDFDISNFIINNNFDITFKNNRYYYKPRDDYKLWGNNNGK